MTDIPPTKLTDYELEALLSRYNFADGHARDERPASASRALRQVEHYILSPRAYRRENIECAFSDAFFGLAHQRAPIETDRVLYCGSASLSIEILANYLRLKRLSVALIEPAFDNLADILRRQCVGLIALSEDRLRDHDWGWLDDVGIDAVFLVLPNNPTGYLCSEADFQHLVERCAARNKLLILDFSLRFFAQELFEWDQYALLEQSGVRYVAIEDTGKTWPTFELKVSALAADPTTFPALRSIYTDIFLYLSPLNFIFLTEYITDSQRDGLDETVWRVHRANREQLRAAITAAPLRPLSPPTIGVEWIRIEHSMSDVEFMNRLGILGIRIIPGRYFYWSNPEAHTDCIRIALMRDVHIFAEGMDILRQALPRVFDA